MIITEINLGKIQFVQMNINQWLCQNVATLAVLVLVSGDETAQVGSADCKLSPMLGALQCPHHPGWAEPKGERPCTLPSVCQERGREVGHDTETLHTQEGGKSNKYLSLSAKDNWQIEKIQYVASLKAAQTLLRFYFIFLNDHEYINNTTEHISQCLCE